MRSFLALTLATAFLLTASAQAPDRYKARLSPLGVTGSTVNTITGGGSVTGTLAGAKLTIEGTFEGLAGPATAANLRRGPKAIPGPVVFDLQFTKGVKGTVTGSLDLKPDQVDDLKAGRLYVQVHSEKAPDGSIRGWLLK